MATRVRQVEYEAQFGAAHATFYGNARTKMLLRMDLSVTAKVACNVAGGTMYGVQRSGVSAGIMASSTEANRTAIRGSLASRDQGTPRKTSILRPWLRQTGTCCPTWRREMGFAETCESAAEVSIATERRGSHMCAIANTGSRWRGGGLKIPRVSVPAHRHDAATRIPSESPHPTGYLAVRP